MSLEARIKIDSHRLMRTQGNDLSHEIRVESARRDVEARKKKERYRWKHRAKVHVFIFAVSFIFSIGIFTLGILLWVKPGDLLPLLLTGLFSSTVFVGSFAWLRMFILHRLFDEYPNKEEDPGMSHHLTKSIAYGFVALVFALVLAGLVINVAQAGIL